MSSIKDNLLIFITIFVSFIGWLISFIGAIVFRRGISGGAWWIIVFELLLILATTTVMITNTYHHYRLVILTFLAVSISLVTYQLDDTLPTSKFPSPYHRGASAYAAGYILIMIVQFLWVIIFGSELESYVGQYAPRHRNTVGVVVHPPQQPMNSTGEKTILTSNEPEFTEKVQALHAYNANPDDPNEISFSKGETLEVVDRNGNWWHARKSDGTIGIIPSNYFSSSLV